jgi:hypothetical protein
MAALELAMDLRKQRGQWPGYGPLPKENDSMERIVCTPAGSEMGIGTVIMPRPTKPLTMEQYQGYLDGRITRMVRRAGLAQASQMLSRTAEVAEGLSVSQRPLEAGEIMVFNSDLLTIKSGMSGQNWPIPASEIKPELDPPLEVVEETDLEEWLGMLCPGV